MALTIGTQLGSHEITAMLGKGGMGEVYRARDTRLKRDVAIKIFPVEVLSDASRLSRFQREAEVLASLNHPNIAAIYDFQQDGETRYLVLELVEGETLAERIQRGPIPVEEALEIGKHIGEALEAAHEKGIVHRDLKPANVKPTSDGRVKVLDFGLAKAMEATPAAGSLSNSPTLTIGATQAGVILGTAAYMSPEQAKGFEVDARSDTFSFGSVLYEMLTGRPAFHGDTVAEVLASVLVREPDFSLLPANLNPRIAELLQRCLQKNPKRRWQSVVDLRAELEIIAKAPRAAAVASVATAPPRPLWKRAGPILLTAIIFSTLAAIAGWKLKPPAPLSIGRFSLVLPEGQNFTRTRSQVAAISRDGTSVVYVANRQLYMRRLGELESRPIQGTQQDVSSPFFSPDGQWIGFYSFQDSSIKKVPITGGAAITLCSGCAATLAYGMSWEGETIVVGRGGGEIMAIPATGGKPEVWVNAEEGEAFSGPQLLPTGDAVMFSVSKSSMSWDKADIVVLSRKTGKRHIIVQGGSNARYIPTGHIVYSLANSMYAVSFDIERLKTAGGAIPVVDDIMRSTGEYGPAQFNFSENGTLSYVPTSSAFAGEGQRIVALAEINGKTTLIPGLPPGTYTNPRVSPDAKHIAIETANDGSISIYDMSGKSQLRRLTLDGVNNMPVWSPDGRQIAYRSNRESKFGVFVQNADGTGNAERITTASPSGQEYPFAWSKDGKLILTRDQRLWTMTLSGERKIEPLTAGGASLEYGATLSPDEHWVAYSANDQRKPGARVYVKQFPTGATYQISREPSEAPAWSPDGK